MSAGKDYPERLSQAIFGTAMKALRLREIRGVILTISLLYYSMEEDKPGMRGKVPAKHLAWQDITQLDARGHGDSEWAGKATTAPIKWLRILLEFLVLWVQTSLFLLAPRGGWDKFNIIGEKHQPLGLWLWWIWRLE